MEELFLVAGDADFRYSRLRTVEAERRAKDGSNRRVFARLGVDGGINKEEK